MDFRAPIRMLSLSILAASCLGCAGLKSRYALDNEVYAEKYAVGAEKSDVLGKLKQASDARWVKDQQGTFLGGGVLVSPDSGNVLGSLSLGKEWYKEPWFSHRLSLDGILNTSTSDHLLVGLDLGARVQVPSRLAPFVGTGGTVGFSAFDLIDTFQEDDGFENNGFEDDTDWDAFAAVYPEVGVHFWTNGRYRFTVFGRYLISTSGRRNDGWLIGGQLLRF